MTGEEDYGAFSSSLRWKERWRCSQTLPKMHFPDTPLPKSKQKDLTQKGFLRHNRFENVSPSLIKKNLLLSQHFFSFLCGFLEKSDCGLMWVYSTWQEEVCRISLTGLSCIVSLTPLEDFQFQQHGGCRADWLLWGDAPRVIFQLCALGAPLTPCQERSSHAALQTAIKLSRTSSSSWPSLTLSRPVASHPRHSPNARVRWRCGSQTNNVWQAFVVGLEPFWSEKQRRIEWRLVRRVDFCGSAPRGLGAC